MSDAIQSMQGRLCGWRGKRKIYLRRYFFALVGWILRMAMSAILIFLASVLMMDGIGLYQKAQIGLMDLILRVLICLGAIACGIAIMVLHYQKTKRYKQLIKADRFIYQEGALQEVPHDWGEERNGLFLHNGLWLMRYFSLSESGNQRLKFSADLKRYWEQHQNLRWFLVLLGAMCLLGSAHAVFFHPLDDPHATSPTPVIMWSFALFIWLRGRYTKIKSSREGITFDRENHECTITDQRGDIISQFSLDQCIAVQLCVGAWVSAYRMYWAECNLVFKTPQSYEKQLLFLIRIDNAYKGLPIDWLEDIAAGGKLAQQIAQALDLPLLNHAKRSDWAEAQSRGSALQGKRLDQKRR